MLQTLSSYRRLSVVDKILLFFLLVALVVIVDLYFVNAKRVNPLGDFSAYADDTYIHLRFANHLASGEGIVWNKGEPPVEGSTSFLYLLMITAIEMSGIQPIWTLPYLNAFFSTILLLNVFILLQILNPKKLIINLTVTVMLGLFPPIMVWSASGLEVMLYAFAILLCASLYILYRKGVTSPYIAGFAFAITSFIRPECLLLFSATAVFELFVVWLSDKKVYKQSAGLIGTFFLFYLPIFLWKWSYFGYPFPNTYYAKTGGGITQLLSGISYLKNNLVENFIPAGFLGIVFLATFRKDSYFVEKLYLCLLLFTSWIVVAINGGDYMGKARFLTPTISFLYILGGSGISRIMDRIKKSALQLGLILILLAAAFLDWQAENPILIDYGNKRFPGASMSYKPKYIISTPEFVFIGKALKRISDPGDSIALVPIGAIGYYSEMTVYDMVGLVDPHIAHEPFSQEFITDSWKPGHDKGDGLYILSLKPTYILLVDRLTLEPIEGVDDWALQYKSIVEIWNSEQFHKEYNFCPFQANGWYINLYCRKAEYLQH